MAVYEAGAHNILVCVYDCCRRFSVQMSQLNNFIFHNTHINSKPRIAGTGDDSAIDNQQIVHSFTPVLIDKQVAFVCTTTALILPIHLPMPILSWGQKLAWRIIHSSTALTSNP